MNIQEFQSFADGAKDGLIIVFTLGSLIPVSTMPKEALQSFIQTFAKLPQRIVWKWEDKVPENMPENIMLTNWLPQQDLLGR